MVVFSGHLGLVSSGAVCVLPGMAPMADGVPAGAGAAEPGSMPGMAAMKGMAGMTERADAAASSHDQGSTPSDRAPAEQGPCSGPASGQCLASMPCVTALGSDVVATTLALPPTRRGDVLTLAVRMPASSTVAPPLPPPRA